MFDTEYIIQYNYQKVNTKGISLREYGDLFMKSTKNIFIAFILNLFFSIFEFIGGIITGSVAIISDAIHDAGDAFSIGISFFLERISKKSPDKNHTFGYTRYSILGSIITTLTLLVGSIIVIYNAIEKIIDPSAINYNGMIILAIIGVAVNSISAFVTREGDSLNQKAVNLHMLEDVLGWCAVLVGAIVMKLTNFTIIDPLMSIGVAIFIIINALDTIKEAINIILEKVPEDICTDEIKHHLSEIDGVIDISHIHVWSLDGHNHCAMICIVCEGDRRTIKDEIRREFHEFNINHCTIEIAESSKETSAIECNLHTAIKASHHHHHHHHHHRSHHKHCEPHHHDHD